jgi:hypothetical protein
MRILRLLLHAHSFLVNINIIAYFVRYGYEVLGLAVLRFFLGGGSIQIYLIINYES